MMTKELILILSSVMAAAATEGDSYRLSAWFNAEKYATVVKKHQLVLKHNTTRREVSLMSDKVGGKDEGQYEMEENFKKANGERKDGAWIFRSNVLSGSRFDNNTYIVYAIAGETFLIRSWSLNDTTLSVTLKEGDSVLLNASFNTETYKCDEDTKKQLVLKYNVTKREAFLMFNKVGSQDEGQYEIKESFNKSNGDTYSRKDGACIFRLNVLEPDEIKRGNIGENLTILRLNKSTTSFTRLYYYDQLVTVLRDDSCDISTGSRFYGRLRCESDNVENRYRIEMQNVAQMDTGLYRVNTDGHDTEQCFLNITDQAALVKGTTATSRLNTVAIHYSSDGIYYSHLSTESLPSTVKSISSDNTGILWSVLVYIIPIISGVVGVIMLMIRSLVLIQRKNTHNLEAVQRLILEKCETESNATPGWEEVRTDHLIHQSNTVHFPIMRHQYAAIPMDSPSVDTTYNRTEKLEGDKHRLDVAECIVNHSESSSQFTKDLAEACDKETEGLRKDCTSVCALSFPEGDEAHYSRPIVDGRCQSPASETTEAWYAKVKKGPKFSYKNNCKTENFGNDAYQMVDTSHANDHMNAFQGVEIDTVSTNIPISPFQGTPSPRNDFAHGTKDNDGYETVENAINIWSLGNVKVSEGGDAFNMQEEPKEQKITPGNAENDYADINL